MSNELVDTKAGKINKHIIDLIRQWCISGDVNNLKISVADAIQMSELLHDIETHFEDIDYLNRNYFNFKAEGAPESLSDQKLRIFSYMLDFVTSKNSTNLIAAVRKNDLEIFRTFIFCEITDIVHYNGSTYVKFKNSRKIESAIQNGSFRLDKGPCMISIEKGVGITSFVSLKNLQEVEFLSNATWACFQKGLKKYE